MLPKRAVISAWARLGSTARAAKTRPSSRELDASLLAPCSPVQETSPHANRPPMLVSPNTPVCMMRGCVISGTTRELRGQHRQIEVMGISNLKACLQQLEARQPGLYSQVGAGAADVQCGRAQKTPHVQVQEKSCSCARAAHLDSATHVMLCGGYRNRVASHIQPILLALLSNVGKVLQNQLPRLATAGITPPIMTCLIRSLPCLEGKARRSACANEHSSYHATAAIYTGLSTMF